MKVVIFDGVCNLCNTSVAFILRHDSRAVFHFASLQSTFAREILEKKGLLHVDSIVYVDDETVYTYSDAVLQIAKELDGFYRYLYLLRFIPKVVRDFFYKLTARYRYRIFGKRESCMVPTDALRGRFLE